MIEPEWSLPFNRMELIARCEKLEAALRTIKIDVESRWREGDYEYQFAIIARNALASQSETQGEAKDG